MIVTLDGPAGSGKSTAAKLAARELGFQFLNTGAMYRAVTLSMQRQGVVLDDEDKIRKILDQIEITFQSEKTYLNGEDVTLSIRTPEVDNAVSAVSSLKIVREKMSSLQRKTGLSGDYVVEGRDMGTVVFPDARFQFYIDASAEERANRRFKELSDRGEKNIDYEGILSEIKRRDELDQNREIAPLRVPEKAEVIDTSAMTIEEVVERIVGKVRA